MAKVEVEKKKSAVPSLEEVMAAGYTEMAAVGIVALEEAKAAGKGEEEAGAASDAAVTAYVDRLRKEAIGESDTRPRIYTYLGFTKKESEAWLKAYRANVKMRTTKEYKITRRDGGSVLRAKRDRQKAFSELRERELQEKLKQHQKYRTLGAVTFEKGVPLAVADMVDDSGDPVVLRPEEVFKLNSLVFNGVFSRKPELSEKELKALAAYKPKKKEAAR